MNNIIIGYYPDHTPQWIYNVLDEISFDSQNVSLKVSFSFGSEQYTLNQVFIYRDITFSLTKVDGDVFTGKYINLKRYLVS